MLKRWVLTAPFTICEETVPLGARSVMLSMGTTETGCFIAQNVERTSKKKILLVKNGVRR